MVNILPFRHPLLVAEEAVMLDNLTDGRFDMELGRGLDTRAATAKSSGLACGSRAKPGGAAIRRIDRVSASS